MFGGSDPRLRFTDVAISPDHRRDVFPLLRDAVERIVTGSGTIQVRLASADVKLRDIPSHFFRVEGESDTFACIMGALPPPGRWARCHS